MTSSAALSSVPTTTAPTSDHGSTGSRQSSAPGFLTAVGVELLKMRRLRTACDHGADRRHIGGFVQHEPLQRVVHGELP